MGMGAGLGLLSLAVDNDGEHLLGTEEAGVVEVQDGSSRVQCRCAAWRLKREQVRCSEVQETESCKRSVAR